MSQCEKDEIPSSSNQPVVVPSTNISELSGSSKSSENLDCKMSEIGAAESMNALTHTVSLTSIEGAVNRIAMAKERPPKKILTRPLYGGMMKRSGKITSGEIENLDSSHVDYLIAPGLSRIQEEENEGVDRRGRERYDATRTYRSSSSSSRNSNRSFYAFDDWKKAQFGRHPSRSPQPSDEINTGGEEDADGRENRKELSQHQDCERRQRINQFIQSAKRNSARTRHKR
uniref:Uncharacterized protein n=1 Tax=Chaetoceros debilis TaxID=122233 RepID=A0A7S3PUL3_9STRA|mmetsp:Transcript_4933/g.7246  ORF Transcript_4933/g.7246 Transcript_4933/m.7246 type:complete len:229 (+) Transcript_4933:44-730(+)